MKNIRKDDLDFDFDVKNEKKPVATTEPKVEYSLEPRSPKQDHIRIGGITLDCSDDCLIVRRRTKTTKEKTMIALDEIQSTQVKKVTRPVFLFLAIFFIIVLGIASYPVHVYLENLYITIGCAALGLVLFIIFLIIFLSTRRLQLVINFSSTRNIKYIAYETKMFERLNAFLDEMYHTRHKLRK